MSIFSASPLCLAGRHFMEIITQKEEKANMAVWSVFFQKLMQKEFRKSLDTTARIVISHCVLSIYDIAHKGKLLNKLDTLLGFIFLVIFSYII